MPTFVMIKGTNGSGKSTAVRSLITNLRASSADATLLDSEFYGFDEPTENYGYLLDTPEGKSVVVLGSYDSRSPFDLAHATGGIDRTYNYAGQRDDLFAATEYHLEQNQANVIWEGLMTYGIDYIAEFARRVHARGSRVIVAFMDAPLEVCIANREQRRKIAAAKRGKEYVAGDTDLQAGKYKQLFRHREMLEKAGIECASLNWREPLPQLLQWLEYPVSLSGS
jgi:hypothetical protein